MILVLVLMTFFFMALVVGAALVFLGQLRRLERRFEDRQAAVNERVGILAAALDQINGADDGDSTLTESRKQALEAERRFTEGVANILNFSYRMTGKKGE